MANNFSPYSATTIEGVISAYASEQITEGTLAYKEKINGNIVIKYHNILTKYYDVLTPYIITMELDDTEFQKYQFLPNLLSYDLYGTPELGYSILYINNMVTRTEFNVRKIKVFSSAIMKILKELMTLTNEDINRNRVNLQLD